MPLLTGVQRVTLDELERLDKDLFDTFIICQKPGPLSVEAESKGITCLYVKQLVREISPRNDISALIKLFKQFKEYKFDIVHTHSSKTGVIGRVAAKLARVPLVVHTVHGFAFPAAKSKSQKVLFTLLEWIGTKCSDIVICLHDTDRLIAKNSLGSSDAQLQVIANGVDTSKFYPISLTERNVIRTEISIPHDAILVGMVGRLWEQKNPQTLLNTAINILTSRNDIHFVFVGDGDLRESLEQQAMDHGLSSNIHFLGWRNDTDKILKSLDIFVLPSLWEGMPLAILEAQATGLPCIVSNIQGNNHLVSNEYNGLLFDLNTPLQLHDAVLTLSDSPQLRKKYGSAALQKVLLNHNIDLRVLKIQKSYSDNM